MQDDVLYDTVIAELRPDYVIHGDNWKTGPQAAIRESALRALETYGGQLIEVPYTYSEEVRLIDKRLRDKLANAGISCQAAQAAYRHTADR